MGYVPARKSPIRSPKGAPMSNISSTWIIIGILVVLVVWIIMIYNGLVAMRQRVNQSFADIDVQLKQRSDLIPNLVETVKGYAGHERGTLEAVVKARNARSRRRTSIRKSRLRTCSRAHCGNCLRCRKPIPDLKANANFQQLQARAFRHREQVRRGAALLQQRRAGVQHRHPAIPRRADRRPAWLPRAAFFDLGETARDAGAGAAGEVLSAASSAATPAHQAVRSACAMDPHRLRGAGQG